jgi:ribonuclease HI
MPAALPPVAIYTDGACSGNPGPGGWGVLLVEDGRETELSGGESPTTNQRMELMAPIQGLRSLGAGRRRVDIYSDSAYVINCFRDKWYERWRKNGWLNSQKKPVENRDLWQTLIELVEQHDVTWHKVAGHSGHVENDRVDALARAAIRR